MSTIVISQPTFFPWVGMFEQVALADVYVHYDDVQFSKGWFTNRVQVKTADGPKWLTVPLENHRFGQKINEALVDPKRDWCSSHKALLRQAYQRAPFRDEMLAIVDEVYDDGALSTIGGLSARSIDVVCRYFGFNTERAFLRSSDLPIGGTSSTRVIEIVKHLKGKRYVTGHGARKYLDHEAFEREGIEVDYMLYRRAPYPQLHGAFDPHVSILDLIANCGPEGKAFIASPAVSWRTFLDAGTVPIRS